jgi:hypothetical protein
VEPTSKIDSLRVLSDLGLEVPYKSKLTEGGQIPASPFFI